MKPPFQRNPVWLDRQKSFLIDSILNRYPIPEIYMQEIVLGTEEARYVIVDGQQRVRAILEYLEGRFEIDGKDSPTWADMSFDDLSPEEKKVILKYNFVVRILPEMEDSEIRKIFQRLNRNVLALNMQELRQATYWGPFITRMNALANNRAWREVGVFSPNDIRRMLDVEFISELTIAMLHGPQNKKKNLEMYYQAYEEEFELENSVNDTFTTVLKEILKVLPNIRETRWRKKTDFYTLFLVFSNHRDALPLPREGRARAEELLLRFGSAIDSFVKASPEKEMEFTNTVRKYGAGIRASTDLGSRVRREESLGETLNEVWG